MSTRGRGRQMSTQIVNQAELEVARFLARRPSPEDIIAFRLSGEAVDRFNQLLDMNCNGRLSEDEERELDAYVAIEHLMRLIKAEAHAIRAEQQAS